MIGFGFSVFTQAILGAVGWFKNASLNLDFTSGVLDSRVTFTRASTGTRFNSSGVLESIAINGPRFDYDPVTLAPKGLLIEEQRANLLLQSADFYEIGTGNVNWFYVVGSIASNNQVAPDGTTTADTLTTAGGAQSVYQSATVTASTTYTASVYVKLGTMLVSDYKIAVYNNSTPGFIAADIVPSQTPTTTGWTRIIYTFTTPAGCTSVRIYPFRSSAGISSCTVFLWGAQLEAGAFATSYIPTVASQATRAADIATMTGTNFSSWYNQSEGTVCWEGQSLSPLTPSQSVALGKYPSAWEIKGGTGVTSISWYGAGVEMTINGTYNNQGSVTPLVPHKYAMGVAATGGQSATSLDGATAANRTGTTFGTGHTTFQIGQNLNGTIKRIAYYPRRLTNAELQGITS